ELGHAIGSAHNTDPTMLMCRRPAPCRPTEFQSATEHYFPLTGDEKALLLQLILPIGRPGRYASATGHKQNWAVTTISFVQTPVTTWSISVTDLGPPGLRVTLFLSNGDQFKPAVAT